jgi:hypothetical protein
MHIDDALKSRDADTTCDHLTCDLLLLLSRDNVNVMPGHMICDFEAPATWTCSDAPHRDK